LEDGLTAKLNAKQEMFCLEYIVDLNATQAAIRAGYSKNSANVIGCENLTKPDITERIQALKAERSKRVTCDADYLLTRLMAEAEADLADIYTTEGEIKPVHEWPLIWRQGLLSGLDTQQLPEGISIKAKLSDRTKRLEMIGRHIGFFNDKLTLDGGDSPIRISTPWRITPVRNTNGNG
jgi:phage terminase small subunit|tara:strand:+ start:6107 stop:6643 length:537 start_codon:yes stop_codon:yes gene_type:complete